MAEGHDGYDALKGHRYLVDEENGMLFSAVVRKFLLGEYLLLAIATEISLTMEIFPILSGSQYIQRMAHSGSLHRNHSDIMTLSTLKRVRVAADQWLRLTEARRQQYAQSQPRPQDHTGEYIGDALRIGGRERMGSIDAVDGKSIRDINHPESIGDGHTHEDEGARHEGDLIVVKPVVDGRMRDIGRE